MPNCSHACIQVQSLSSRETTHIEIEGRTEGVERAAQRADEEVQEAGQALSGRYPSGDAEISKKELENEIKKNILQQKELNGLRTKLDALDSQKMALMFNELREKDQKVEEQAQRIRQLERVEKREMSMDIYRKEQELASKVTSLLEENNHLRSKVEQQKKHEDTLNKSLKAQQQQLIHLESKQKPEKQPAKTEASLPAGLKEKHEKLQEDFESLEAVKKATEKQLKQEVESQKSKVRSLEQQLQEVESSLKRKEKEANILSLRLKELERRQHQNLEPLRNEGEEWKSGALFDQRREFKGSAYLQGNPRRFDDTERLPAEKGHRMKELKFVWFEEHIVSLETVYELEDGSLQPVKSFEVDFSYQNVKEGGLLLGEFEYIKDIEVYCSKFIEFLRIRTSKERVLEVGNERSCPKCKQSSFSIRANEKPVAFLGVLDSRKFGKHHEYLVSLGLEIRKKEVQPKKHRPEKTHVGLRDDKNLIDHDSI